jgi:hypothetical protein
VSRGPATVVPAKLATPSTNSVSDTPFTGKWLTCSRKRSQVGGERLTAAEHEHDAGHAGGPSTATHPQVHTMTRQHRGFTHIHPPGLSLIRNPRMERGPFGLNPGLRTMRKRPNP